MEIAVLLKQVPDTWSARAMDERTGRITRDPATSVADEIGERALETALRLKDAIGGRVHVITMGPAQAKDVLRRALAMGADTAVHVLDDALVGADMPTTAGALSSAVAALRPDLTIAGNESTDGRGGIVPAMIARRIGVAYLSNVESVGISGAVLTASRTTEYGSAQVETSLPAVVTVTERSPEPRFPSIRGMMQAKKKPLSVLTAADLAGLPPTRSTVVSVTARPARAGGEVFKDDGTAAERIADFLAGRSLI
jgi:electron transfer flavoprotein beta subunit